MPRTFPNGEEIGIANLAYIPTTLDITQSLSYSHHSQLDSPTHKGIFSCEQLL